MLLKRELLTEKNDVHIKGGVYGEYWAQQSDGSRKKVGDLCAVESGEKGVYIYVLKIMSLDNLGNPNMILFGGEDDFTKAEFLQGELYLRYHELSSEFKELLLVNSQSTPVYGKYLDSIAEFFIEEQGAEFLPFNYITHSFSENQFGKAINTLSMKSVMESLQEGIEPSNY